ncbi:large ribosomal subunit protein mL38-like [Salvelinus alpinus]
MSNSTITKELTLYTMRCCHLMPYVNVPLDRVKAGWEETSDPYHVQRLADHYGIFKDLFPMAYFVPRVTLRVSYDQDSSAQVHYGNHLMPREHLRSVLWQSRAPYGHCCSPAQ